MSRKKATETNNFLRYAYRTIEDKFAKKELLLWNSDWELLVAILNCCANNDKQSPEKICAGLNDIAFAMADAYAMWAETKMDDND